MKRFTVKLAGVPIAVEAIYDGLFSFCKDYLTEEEPVLSVGVTLADIAHEQALSDREADYEGRPRSKFPGAYLEALAVYRQLAVKLLDHDVFLMHGSAVCADGEAYLFTAPSGTGKTTHTRLWLAEILGAFVVNGDKPLIRLLQDRIEVCGTPWSGKEGLNRRVNVPLKAICFLERGKRNEISRTSFLETYPLLLQQCYRPTEPEAMRRTLELISRLGEKTAFYRLHCNMEPEAALVAYNGMAREASV